MASLQMPRNPPIAYIEQDQEPFPPKARSPKELVQSSQLLHCFSPLVDIPAGSIRG